MTIEAVSFIKSEIERLTKLVSEKLDFLRKVEESAKGLEAERQKAIGEVNQLNGAVHGFNTSLSKLEPTVAAVETLVSEPN